MTTTEILERFKNNFDEILTMDGYDDAIVGVAEIWAGHTRQSVACYDFDKCVELLLEDSDMSEEDAEEYLEFNCLGAYLGELTPVFLHDWRDRADFYKPRRNTMDLEGIKTIYDGEVAYVNVKQNVAPQALDPKAMINFCSPSDAEQVFAIAKQVVPDAQLVGTTGEFTAQWNPSTYILQPGPNETYAQADSSGGQYMYRSANGYRPIRIQSLSQGLDQFVSELVQAYIQDGGTKNGLNLVSTPQGKKLIWA